MRNDLNLIKAMTSTSYIDFVDYNPTRGELIEFILRRTKYSKTYLDLCQWSVVCNIFYSAIGRKDLVQFVE